MGHDDDHDGPADPDPPAPDDATEPSENVVDLWRNTGYTPHGFYTVASDDQGHHSAARVVAIPPQVASRVHECVDSSAYPSYTTVGAFIRDAIVHRLAWLAEQRLSPEADELREEIAAVVFQQTLADVTRRTELFRSNVSAARNLAMDLARARDMVGLCQLASATRSQAMMSRPPFKASYLELARTFDELAAQVRTREEF